MIIELPPNTAQMLQHNAQMQGMSLDDYLQYIATKDTKTVKELLDSSPHDKLTMNDLINAYNGVDVSNIELETDF